MTTEKLMEQKKHSQIHTHHETAKIQVYERQPRDEYKKGKDSCKLLISNVNRKLSQPHPVFSKAILS